MDSKIVSQWKDIPNTNGFYQANVNGEIRSVSREYSVICRWGFNVTRRIKGKVLKPWPDTSGYLVVYICGDGRREAINAHRLIALTFIECDNELKTDVNHIDGNKQNNCADNLEWCTRSENMIHAIKIGLFNPHIRKLGIGGKRIKGTPIKGGEPIFFNTRSEAEIGLGKNHGGGNITAAALGKLKQAYGYYWEYV